MHRGLSVLPHPRASQIVVFVLLGLRLSIPAPVPADDETGPGEESSQVNQARTQRLEQMVAEAAEYQLLGDEDKKETFKRHDRPVLRWSNPERATADGGLFLWTNKNRPAAVLCIYGSGVDRVDHEWQSLSTEPFQASYRGTTVWRPRTAGLEFKRLPGKPEPAAATPVRRLTQMHRLLNDFSGSIAREHELRALTQPLYRYADENTDLVDGAVFALAQATDPEILLLFEARRGGDQPATWWWAAARMSMVPLELKYRDESVWTINWNRDHDARQPYITFVRQRPEP